MQVQYDIIRATAKILALLSDKIDEYEYLTSDEVFPTQEYETIEVAKFTYSSLCIRKNKQKQLKIKKKMMLYKSLVFAKSKVNEFVSIKCIFRHLS